MPPKKASTPDETGDNYVYEDNLSIRVKESTERENPALDHYFGDLLREQIVIDRKSKYCCLCLQMHVIKRSVSK